MSAVQSEAGARVIIERRSQNRKWGEQNHDMPTWLAILHEETGELSQAVLHAKFGGPAARDLFKEAVQVAAVALQIVEFLIRKRAICDEVSEPEAPRKPYIGYNPEGLCKEVQQ
jgi:NTP pyrophosphatase (non-canonical NTP hydrolase)